MEPGAGGAQRGHHGGPAPRVQPPHVAPHTWPRMDPPHPRRGRADGAGAAPGRRLQQDVGGAQHGLDTGEYLMCLQKYL